MLSLSTPEEASAEPLDASSVKAWLRRTGRNQNALASQIGVGPPIVSMWMTRKLSCARHLAVTASIAKLMASEGALDTALTGALSSPALAGPPPRKHARTVAAPSRPAAPPPRPGAWPHWRLAALSTPSPQRSAGAYVDDGEVVFLREGVSARGSSILRTAPHGRDQCELEPLGRAEQPASACCALCYCAVCDVPARSCPAWAVHCEATLSGPSAPYWRSVRRAQAEARGTAKRRPGGIREWLSGGAAGGAGAPPGSAAPVSARGAAEASAEEADAKPSGGAAAWMQVKLQLLAESESESLVGLEVRSSAGGGDARH